ncbi:hypothetical protein GINT2_000446 [Glugoides intestinalis]
MAFIYDMMQQEIFLWQKLIWSNQPGALLSTALFIEMSIAILFIMTWLKEEEKEEKEKYYYNNLLNGFLTILLTIISGFIFGKGLEILFRTLHICSGAYGNVVFSLDDIFISLLFGCIFVSFGYFLLFNKKLYKLLRLLSVDADKEEKVSKEEIIADNGPATVMELEEKVAGKGATTVDGLEDAKVQTNGDAELPTSEDAELEKRKAELEKIMANDETEIVDRLIAMLDYLELTMEGKPEGTVTKLKKIYFEINETVDSLCEIWIKISETVNSLWEMKAKLDPNVKAELKNKDKSIVKLTSELNEKLLNYELNEAGLDGIMAGLEQIEAGLEEFKEILTNFKAAELEKRKAELEKRKAELEKIMANDETEIVDRLIAMLDYLELTMEGKPEGTVTKLKKIYFEINETVDSLCEIWIKISETVNSLWEMKAKLDPNVKAELKNKDKSIVKLTSELNEKLLNYELNEAGLDGIMAGLEQIEAGLEEFKEILTNFKAAKIAKRRATRKRAAERRAAKERAAKERAAKVAERKAAERRAARKPR